MDDQAAERTYGVGELAALLGRILLQAFPGTVWVQGQIRNLSRSVNGHVYFDLAEPGPLGAAPSALIPVTLLAPDKPLVNATLTGAGAGRMEDGVEVRIAGRVSWFAPRGRLQLRMVAIDPADTLGRLLEDRDRLLAALRAEGLLDRNGRLALPPLPLRIAVVTSAGSAAHADFVHEIERSGLGFQVLEIDARTQGVDAGRSVAAGLWTAQQAGVDLVALVRGGGSRTDLAPFDGEVIARAVAGCGIPVFTGIGHEVDRCIADEVAHSSFKTPTACAAAIVDQVTAALGRIDELWDAIARMAEHHLRVADEHIGSNSRRVARSTVGALASADQALDHAGHRLRRDAVRALTVAEQRLAGAAVRANALDPALTLARGWSITRDAEGRLVRSADQVRTGQALTTTLARGTVGSTITTVQEDAVDG